MCRIWSAMLACSAMGVNSVAAPVATLATEPPSAVEEKARADDPESIVWGEPVDGLQAGISCGVRRYDFANPPKDKTPKIACFIRNSADKKIEFTAAFGSYEMHLIGQGASHQWASILWSQSRDEPKQYTLALGEQITVFESTVWPVFEPDGKKWRWDWMARLRPPISPVRTWAGEGYEKQASFWFVIRPRPDNPEIVVESQKIVVQFRMEEAPQAPDLKSGADSLKEK